MPVEGSRILGRDPQILFAGTLELGSTLTLTFKILIDIKKGSSFPLYWLAGITKVHHSNLVRTFHEVNSGFLQFKWKFWSVEHIRIEHIILINLIFRVLRLKYPLNSHFRRVNFWRGLSSTYLLHLFKVWRSLPSLRQVGYRVESSMLPDKWISHYIILHTGYKFDASC